MSHMHTTRAVPREAVVSTERRASSSSSSSSVTSTLAVTDTQHPYTNMTLAPHSRSNGRSSAVCLGPSRHLRHSTSPAEDTTHRTHRRPHRDDAPNRLGENHTERTYTRTRTFDPDARRPLHSLSEYVPAHRVSHTLAASASQSPMRAPRRDDDDDALKPQHNHSDVERTSSPSVSSSSVTPPLPQRARPARICVTVTRDGVRRREMVDAVAVARLLAVRQAARQQVRRRLDLVAVPQWAHSHPHLGAYVAEFLGTFAWVVTLAMTHESNQSIFDTKESTAMISVPLGWMWASMTSALAYLSGGYLNPALTVAALLVRRLTVSRCAGYLLCQVVAALVAGLAAMGMQGSTRVIFAPSVSKGYVSTGFFSELIYTFAMATVVLHTGVTVPSSTRTGASTAADVAIHASDTVHVREEEGNPRQKLTHESDEETDREGEDERDYHNYNDNNNDYQARSRWACTPSFYHGMAVGMTMVAGMASVGQISGGAFNPAAATGLQMAMCLFDTCEPMRMFWLYWIAPLSGSALAAMVFSEMRAPSPAEAHAEEQEDEVVDWRRPSEAAVSKSRRRTQFDCSCLLDAPPRNDRRAYWGLVAQAKEDRVTETRTAARVGSVPPADAGSSRQAAAAASAERHRVRRSRRGRRQREEEEAEAEAEEQEGSRWWSRSESDVGVEMVAAEVPSSRSRSTRPPSTIAYA